MLEPDTLNLQRRRDHHGAVAAGVSEEVVEVTDHNQVSVSVHAASVERLALHPLHELTRLASHVSMSEHDLHVLHLQAHTDVVVLRHEELHILHPSQLSSIRHTDQALCVVIVVVARDALAEALSFPVITRDSRHAQR